MMCYYLNAQFQGQRVKQLTKSMRESPALVQMMWKQLEEKILLSLPGSTSLYFGCGKETGNFLTYRETSISKVKYVSRVATVIGCHTLWLVRILQKSVTLILTVR